MSDQEPSAKRPRRSSRRSKNAPTIPVLDKLLQLLKDPQQRFLVFTGSGISQEAGLSIFSDPNGLYAQAAQQFNIQDGSQVFRYRFLQEQPANCFSFFTQLYQETQTATPTTTHEVLQQLLDQGRVVRHYTMNIDGLHRATATSSISNDKPVVELHGSLHELVCQTCGHIYPTSEWMINNNISTIKCGKEQLSKNKLKDKISSKTAIHHNIPPDCTKCNDGKQRFRVLMYDDERANLISSNDNPLETLLPQQDIPKAAAILWIGISFQQQASCVHFQKVWNGDGYQLVNYIVNPDATEARDNLESVVGGLGENIMAVEIASDELFRKLS